MEQTAKLPISSWDYILDQYGVVRPYERRPVISFNPDQYFYNVIQKNKQNNSHLPSRHTIHVRIQGTDGVYDGDHTGVMLSHNKLMLISIWEGYPRDFKHLGTVQILPSRTLFTEINPEQESYISAMFGIKVLQQM